MSTGMTTMEVKKINKSKVYHYIYAQKTTCKQEITQGLQMGLSTVTQNLKLLENEGLIQKSGFYHSTGGRKPNAICIIANSKISIGIAILKHSIDIVATNLYGEMMKNDSYPISFIPENGYYQKIGTLLSAFIIKHQLKENTILGVSIATQGIVSSDGLSISYGILLNNSSMTLQHFQQYIAYPCRLAHDSKAAAQLELWQHQEIRHGVVFLLNRNLGGAIISHGEVQYGINMRSGTLEHLIIDTNGKFSNGNNSIAKLCYCGQRGCLETYCSGDSLEERAKMNLTDFFKQCNKKDTTCTKIWQEYLYYLAKGIRNISVIVDGTYILSGYLSSYISLADRDYLLHEINAHATFPLTKESLLISSNGTYAQALGASLYYIKLFLNSI